MASNLKYPTGLRNARGDAITTYADNVFATGTLTNNGSNVANGDTITIGYKTYTFQTSLTNSDGNVLIGASNSASMTNLYNAINLGTGAGSTYAASMTQHYGVTATNPTGTTVVVTAVAQGAAGNNIATTKSSTNSSWGASTLTGGAISAALLKIYAGSQPADANTAISGQTLLATLTCTAVFAPASSGGVTTLNTITSGTAVATGTAAFFRLFKADGSTVVCDGTVGTSASDININSTAIQTGATVSVTSATFTQGNA